MYSNNTEFIYAYLYVQSHAQIRYGSLDIIFFVIYIERTSTNDFYYFLNVIASPDKIF